MAKKQTTDGGTVDATPVVKASQPREKLPYLILRPAEPSTFLVVSATFDGVPSAMEHIQIAGLEGEFHIVSVRRIVTAVKEQVTKIKLT